MKKISVSLTEEHVDELSERADDSDIGSRSAALREILDEYDTLRTECDDLRTERDQLHTECEDLRTRCEEAEAERDRLDDEISELEEEVETKENRISELESDLATRPDAEHVDELQERIDDLESEVESLEARNTDLTNQLAQANTRIDAANDLVEYVEDEKSAQERWREAGLIGKAKYTVFGMPTNDDE